MRGGPEAKHFREDQTKSQDRSLAPEEKQIDLGGSLELASRSSRLPLTTVARLLTANESVGAYKGV